MNVREIEKDEKAYEEMLNEIYGVVDICGMKFDAGRALKELDPIAFNCGLSDEPILYECGNCGEQYEDEDKAEKCCTPDPEL